MSTRSFLHARSADRSAMYPSPCAHRMILFAERYSDFEILPPLTAKLSWAHFIEMLPLKSEEAYCYYANDATMRNYGAKELRRKISHKASERREIDDMQEKITLCSSCNNCW